MDQYSFKNRELSFRDGISILVSEDKQEPVKYLAVLNTTDNEKILDLPVISCELKGALTVKDLWANKILSSSGDKGHSVTVPAHGGRLYSMSKK